MKLDFEKMGGLIPAIVQDNNTNKVLMLGFMNEEAYEETKETGKVTFFSRTKNRLWMKGETSGNTLQVVSMMVDCDNDTILIKANPAGPVCHTGADTCFGEKNAGLYRTAPPGNAGRLLYDFPVFERCEPYGPESGRGSG